MTFYSIVVLGVALCVLIYAEWKETALLMWISKPLASLAFVALALVMGALKDDYGRMVLVALVLSTLGDILLIPKSDKIFKLGVFVFLLAHVAFIAAFYRVGQVPQMTWPFLLLMAGFSFFVLRWVWPHVGRDLKGAVGAYILVITAMVVLAAGASPLRSPLILFAAIFFYFSDIMVARDKFVHPGFQNRALGLPLYYLAQVMFALSIQSV